MPDHNKKMTDEEAERMAQLLWPPNGHAWITGNLHGHDIHVVGYVAMCMSIKGIGLSWESAFNEARTREVM